LGESERRRLTHELVRLEKKKTEVMRCQWTRLEVKRECVLRVEEEWSCPVSVDT
jgi:hypothetical protein